jgi:hypothetical protein
MIFREKMVVKPIKYDVLTTEEYGSLIRKDIINRKELKQRSDKMKVEIEMEVPKGYKVVGYDYVRTNEYYITSLDGKPKKWEHSHCSCGKCIILEPVIKQGEELIGCLCGVSDYSLENAECKSETFFQVEVIIGYHYGEYITQCNSRWKYAYPVSEETYIKYLTALKK